MSISGVAWGYDAAILYFEPDLRVAREIASRLLAMTAIVVSVANRRRKKTPDKPGFSQSEGLSLRDLNIRSLFTFGSCRHVERNLLVLFERLEASRLNRREMREKIVATAIGSDKAKTFSVVKPFNRTCCHISYPKS